MTERITINRAPVLTLWATVVAERLGFDGDAALTLGKAMAGLTAQTKGRMLGIYKPGKGPEGGPPKKFGLGEEFWVELCGRPVPAKNTDDGVRAVVKDKPIDPESVQRYLRQKFGADLAAAREAMAELAGAFEPEDLAERAYPLYERFRPKIPAGKRGWGAKGELDLAFVRSLAGED
jgi:hypothetical protein